MDLGFIVALLAILVALALSETLVLGALMRLLSRPAGAFLRWCLRFYPPAGR